MIRRNTYNIDSLGISIQESEFVMNNEEKVIHAMFHVTSSSDLFSSQLKRLVVAFRGYIQDKSDYDVAFGRCFVSDSANQVTEFGNSSLAEYNFAFIQQPPLDGSKIALWAYLRKHDENSPYTELWSAGLHSDIGSSFDQTRTLLEDYEQYLIDNGCNISEQCVRTWFFVRDVDTQYKGMVDARRVNFENVGMTDKTHYLSSTGIGGLPASIPALVQMDAFAVRGLKPGMQRYLYAKSHLNSTYEYGVTFERGTAIDYPDHTEIYISGTASIDNKGNVLYVGDVVRQTERMLENVSELLKEGGAGFENVMQAIVYLRDVADYQIVNGIVTQRMPADLPLVITYAPVCRPTWLIEMECIAYVSND